MSFRAFLGLALAFLAGASFAVPVKTEHVEAELVAEKSAAEPGKTLTVALRLGIIPHWHTYWRNPGDSGEPTTLEWRLPAGWRAGPIQWPAPRRLPAKHLMNFGYEGEVLHLVDIAVPANASGTAKLAARARWLVCDPERCIPEEGLVTLELPVGAGGATRWTRAIERTRGALPVKAGFEWRFAASRTAGGVELEIAPPAGIAPTAFQFFPFEEGKIRNGGAQRFENSRLSIPRAEQPIGAFNRVAGVLVAQGLPRPLEIDVPVAGGGGAALAGFGVAVLFAFLGGLILNLMPCVLPVLSIKILGFAGHGPDTRTLRLHGALYALGVVASFLLLAALLAAVNAAGAQVGWGFQLQSPVFVALLAALFLALALNLSGVFEFGSLDYLPKTKNPHAQAFLTGVLAVAVASPCTAPFMGAALGYSLGESAAVTLAVFLALGLGMALPYAALAWHPGWLRRLPRPGPWMARMKQILAIPLYATVLWLGWVLAIQSGVLAADSRWEAFSVEKIRKYEAQGKTVFVDFTAAWCVTCQVNKQLVLQAPEVERAFRDSGVVRLRADWTRRDEEITRTLAGLGRKGVPVYAIYRPGREPELLPEILTQDMVFTALRTTKERSR
jgi:thiol:disulfide interchange protein DsbD